MVTYFWRRMFIWRIIWRLCGAGPVPDKGRPSRFVSLLWRRSIYGCLGHRLWRRHTTYWKGNVCVFKEKLIYSTAIKRQLFTRSWKSILPESETNQFFEEVEELSKETDAVVLYSLWLNHFVNVLFVFYIDILPVFVYFISKDTIQRIFCSTVAFLRCGLLETVCFQTLPIPTLLSGGRISAKASIAQ